MKNAGKFLAALALVSLGYGRVQAQTPGEEHEKHVEVSSLISSGRYTFVASKINNKSGTEPLKDGYVLDISKDTLEAHLPGYKRVDAAQSIDSSLTCTRFSYSRTKESNGNWLVTIKPEAFKAGDFGPIHEVTIDIKPDGYATLNVRGNKPISCYGYIKEHGAVFVAANFK